MSTSFPTGLDTLTNPTATDKVAVVSHSSQHANANDAIEALQAKVGANSSAVTTSHDYKLGEVTGTDKAVGKTATQTLTNKTLTSPTINNAAMSFPTGITATDVGLSVTNDAQLKRAAGDLNTFTQKVAPEAADVLIIEDSSASYAKKKVLASTFGVGQPGQFLKNFTSRTAITLGQPVGISNLINSYVSPSNLSVTNTAHGITSPVSDILRRHRCSIGGNKFAYINVTTAASDTIFVQVGEVNPITNTVTLGTAVTVATAAAPNTAGGISQAVSISKLDTDKFIVLYVVDGATTDIKYRVGTVSGTTITLGTEATFLSPGSTTTSSRAIVADYISTDKGVAVVKVATGANSKVVAFTVSGTVVTVGTPVALGAVNQSNNLQTSIRTIGTDKFVICTADTTSLYSQVGTISGTTITLGSEVTTTISTILTNSDLSIISPTTDVYIVGAGISGGSTNNIVAFTVSGTVPTAGTPVSLSSGIKFSLTNKDTTTSYFFDGTNKNLKLITRSGTTLTVSSLVNSFSASTSTTSLYMDNGYPIALNSTSTTLDTWIYGMSNNFIGFAQSAVSSGQQVAVSYTGIDTNQTGLIAGSAYSPNDGVLTVTDNSFTSNTIKALSATEVIFLTTMTNDELLNEINQLENELKQFKYDYSKHQHSNVDGTNLLRKNISLDGDQSLNVGLQQMVQVPTIDVGTSREAIGFATSLSKNDNKGFTNKYDGLQVNYTHKPNGTESLITALRGPAVSPLEGATISVTAGGSTVTIDGYNFTTNELAGCLIDIINSSGTITDCKTISSNTSNVITISGTWSSSVSGAVFIIYRPVYLGSKQFIWQRFYTQEGVDGGIRFGVGETDGGQNGLLYMDSAGDLYWRDKAGTPIKLNV